MKPLFCTFAVLVVVLSGCSDGTSSSVMSAEFRTMASCLEGIKRNTGSTLNVITDNPDKVSGTLSDGRTFACERKSTGTKGTYYEGWFVVK